jgi:CDR ABC transporter
MMPGWWVWYYYLNPIAWTLYGIIVTQLGDFNDALITLPNGTQQTVPAYLNDNFGFEYSFRGWVVAILLAFTVGFAGCAALAMKVINYERR